MNAKFRWHYISVWSFFFIEVLHHWVFKTSLAAIWEKVSIFNLGFLEIRTETSQFQNVICLCIII